MVFFRFCRGQSGSLFPVSSQLDKAIETTAGKALHILAVPANFLNIVEFNLIVQKASQPYCVAVPGLIDETPILGHICQCRRSARTRLAS
jgi:hypothetical protein